MKKLWLFSMIWLAITSFIFGWVRHADAQGENDSQYLLESMKPYMSETDHITFKYTGFYGSCGTSKDELVRVGSELSEEFGLPVNHELSESNGHPVYSAVTNALQSSSLTLIVAEPQNSSACYVVLRLDASSEEQLAEMLKWQEAADQHWDKLSVEGQWNVMVQGMVSQQQLSRDEDPSHFMNQMVHTFKGQVAESYTDQGTISVSLVSAGFHHFIKSGSNPIELQIALHRESDTGVWRLTAGTPVITSEY
ncbi:YwmB family TATA-box binding protein [Paenibacillus hexagrammi]|uniref:YwmB family TATA-box binding protein n=1 Tax=Paenibacillus hexagrammi TaxID=2908839 RepID=A0ABY3SFD9_9BACL|nr:YwmB family TATA-box binding protein [Paenibacillus sp. YPD9-1]UJF32714.1 YwmB family TATA-box binding protein [Paenibacillus sp. YPD9-1]